MPEAVRTMSAAEEAAWIEANRVVTPKAPLFFHGTQTGYRLYGCRCEPCTASVRVYQREYRSRRHGGAIGQADDFAGGARASSPASAESSARPTALVRSSGRAQVGGGRGRRGG